jgi:ribose 1,5-bisphosphokinase PhnN
MATEAAKDWQSQVTVIPQLRQAWRQLAIQQWLTYANARLEIQAALALRTRDYFDELQQRISNRQAAVKEQLDKIGSLQQSGSPGTTVHELLAKLASEGPVDAQTLNEALKASGHNELPKSVAQGLISQFYMAG